jgi:hypothetical protein
MEKVQTLFWRLVARTEEREGLDKRAVRIDRSRLVHRRSFSIGHGPNSTGMVGRSDRTAWAQFEIDMAL